MRLYRPFDAQALCRSVARERCATSPCSTGRKSRAAGGEPLYLDCVNALYEQGRSDVHVVGGRYGLSSKEFTPAMIKAVFDNLAQPSPKNHFTVGIEDDLCAHEPRCRSEFLDRTGRRCARAVLRARLRRHRGREQGIDQNHRREHGLLRARLFRLRFEEIGRDDRSRICASVRARFARLTSSPRRNFVACHQPFLLETCDVLQRSRAGRNVPAQFATWIRTASGSRSAGKRAAHD